MKRLIIFLSLIPFLIFSQPQFTITDLNGNEWDSNELLEQDITIVIQWFSPSNACWPSIQSVQNFTEAYNKYSSCNKLFFIQIAEWGSETEVISFINDWGENNISTGLGLDDLTIEWLDYGLTESQECWILYPNGTYVNDIIWMADLSQQVLIDILIEDGFIECNSINVPEFTNYCCTHCRAMGEHTLPEPICTTFFDLQGRKLNKKPTEGFYVNGRGEKFYTIK